MNFVQSTKLYFYVRGSSCLNIYFLSSLFPEQCIQQTIPSIASHAMVWIHKKTWDTGWTLKDGMWLLTATSLTWCTGSVGLTAMSLTQCTGSMGLTATSLTQCTVSVGLTAASLTWCSGPDSCITYPVCLGLWAWQQCHLPGVPSPWVWQQHHLPSLLSLGVWQPCHLPGVPGCWACGAWAVCWAASHPRPSGVAVPGHSNKTFTLTFHLSSSAWFLAEQTFFRFT